MQNFKNFTNEKLRNLPFKYLSISDPEFEGLNFLVDNNKSKCWWLFYFYNDRFCGESLGSFDEMPIEEARGKASNLLTDLESGSMKNYMIRFYVSIKKSDREKCVTDSVPCDSNTPLYVTLTKTIANAIADRTSPIATLASITVNASWQRIEENKMLQ